MRFVFLIFLALLILPAPGFAQSGKVPAAPPAAVEAPDRLPDRIIRPMRAIDPMTLRAEGVTIRLWGIRPAQTAEVPLELKALDLMDTMIQEQQVNCKIMGGVMPELIGRCATQSNQDLSLELINNGYAVVDRRQTYNSVFASGYEKAQEQARLNARGVWALLSDDEAGFGGPKWLQPYMGFILPFALLLGPLIGLTAVALVAHNWLKSMARTQQQEAEQASNKETLLLSRERQILLTTLEGELTENKNKIEAFLVIYGDMLRSLKDGAESPKYQQIGDIVQKHPSFSKTVFEANVNKLSLLDIAVAGHVSKLYSGLPHTTEYLNLDPNVPIETAVKLVEKVLKDTEEYLPPINQALSELQAMAARKS